MVDTGPPYPGPTPAPGSNAIGSFAIGISPIGDIPLFDVWQTVISQFANSPILTQLITNLGQYLDQTQNIDEFFDLIWNLQTAQGYGLDVWGKILGVSRVLSLPQSATYFGFNEADSWVGFNQGPFFSGQTISNNFTLSDDAYRTLLFAKAAANICDGSIPAINQLLINLFKGQGNCYVLDGLDMTMTYTFQFILTPVQLAIVTNSGVLPRTSGCTVLVVQGAPPP